MRFLFDAFGRLNGALARTARVVVIAQATIMVTAIAIQVVTRTTLNWSPPWTEEVALLMFGWIVMLMIAIGIREHLHVRVDVLASILPPLPASVLERLIQAIVAAVAAYLLWAGYGYLQEMRGSTSNAIRYPMEWLYFSVPVSASLMLLFAVENLLRPVLSDKVDDHPLKLASEDIVVRPAERGL